ncbi:MAG: hypothetical protein EB037_11475 [Actinobacteria bacterium]|nr:hypothetical protein [Actinomycetota bacterium]
MKLQDHEPAIPDAFRPVYGWTPDLLHFSVYGKFWQYCTFGHETYYTVLITAQSRNLGWRTD